MEEFYSRQVAQVEYLADYIEKVGKKPTYTGIINQSMKGGMGKTLLSASIAGILSKYIPVLAVDLDFSFLGLTPSLRGSAGAKDYSKGIDHVLISECKEFLRDVREEDVGDFEKVNLCDIAVKIIPTADDEVYETEELPGYMKPITPTGCLYLTPTTPGIRQAEDYLRESGLHIVRKIFDEQLDSLDPKPRVVIFDCPAGILSHLTQNAIVASNYNLMPVYPDELSITAVAGYLEWLDDFIEKHNLYDSLDRGFVMNEWTDNAEEFVHLIYKDERFSDEASCLEDKGIDGRDADILGRVGRYDIFGRENSVFSEGLPVNLYLRQVDVELQEIRGDYYSRSELDKDMVDLRTELKSARRSLIRGRKLKSKITKIERLLEDVEYVAEEWDRLEKNRREALFANRDLMSIVENAAFVWGVELPEKFSDDFEEVKNEIKSLGAVKKSKKRKR